MLRKAGQTTASHRGIPNGSISVFVTMLRSVLLLFLLPLLDAFDLETVDYVEGMKTDKPVKLVTKKDLQRALKDKQNPLWLYDFYAPWCVERE